MSLNMRGQLVGDFVSHPEVQLYRYEARTVDHEQLLVLTQLETFAANIQQAYDVDIEFLPIGGERVIDARIVHRNDGGLIQLSEPDTFSDVLSFDGYYWKAQQVDNRPWRSFCRALVVRLSADDVEAISRARSSLTG